MSIPLDVERSFRYSRARRRVFRALADHAPLHPADLSRIAHVDPKTVRWIMEGFPPRYRRERALIFLGLVERVEYADGEYYTLTSAGRRLAAELVGSVGTRSPLERVRRSHAGTRGAAPE